MNKTVFFLALAGLCAGLRADDAFQLYNIVPYAAPGTEARTARDMVEYRARTGCDLALYSLTLDPEGRPAMEKVRRYLASYRALKQKLEGTGVRLGVLVQAILGHWKRVGKEMEDWTRTVNVKGEKVRYCPDDPDFARYITDTFTLIAKERPAFVLTDDDVRAYSHDAECFCPRHIAEFNRRRGTSLAEAEVRERVRTAKQDDEDYRVFLAVQRDMMHRLVRRFRDALDSVDPAIPAGICMSGEETFLAGPLARIIAAGGQVPVMRIGNGCYRERYGTDLAPNVFRTLGYAAYYGDSGIRLLDEADTCPHNLWSKSAIGFFTHLQVAAFSGFSGAKVWYVNGHKTDGTAVSRNYTDVLAENRGILDAIVRETAGIPAAGLAVPCFTNFPNWHLARNHSEMFTTPGTFAERVLMPFGIPFRLEKDFGRDGTYLVSTAAEIARCTDADLERLFSHRVLVTADAAVALSERGRSDLIGLSAAREALACNVERDNRTGRSCGYGYADKPVRFSSLAEAAEVLTTVGFRPYAGSPDFTAIAPGAVLFRNRRGGTVVTTVYHGNMFAYSQFSTARKEYLLGLAGLLDASVADFTCGNEQDVLVQVRRADSDAAFVLATNLNGEPIRTIRFRVPEGMRQAAVLSAGGEWRTLAARREGDWLALDEPLAFTQTKVFRFTRDDVLYVSSQGQKGWIKDAQTLEDFRYAATNDFDYVTFEVGARKLPAGWFDESLPAIVGSGKKPWLVLNKSFVSGKYAAKDFAALAKVGFRDADVVVEANDVALLQRYTAGHPDVRRVLSVDFRFDRADRRLVRVPTPAGADRTWDPWPSIMGDCLAAKVWGVRLPSMRFHVRKRMIDAFHAAGIKVIMDCVNEPVTGGYYRRAGADAFVTAQPSFTRGPREEWPKGEPKKALLFGHRGGEDGLAPEHSAALARLAVAHGMDIIKLDLQRTKDGEIVTSHDSSLKRVFGVNRTIAQMTLAELKELVALPVAGYTNEHIQTLAEVLAIAKDGIPQFGLDFKAFTPAMAEKALAIIAKAGVSEDRIFIITYTLKALAYMKERHPNIRRVMHTSAYYDARTGRWQVYQDVPGHVGVVVPKDAPALTFATRREACQRILDFYKKEYGLYGVNIGVFTGASSGPFGRFRVSAEDVALLRAGGLWVSVYMPTDPVTCDYYRRAGADAFITASAAETADPVEVRVRQTSVGPQVFVDGQAVRPRFYFGSPANLCNMAWTWETQFNVPFRAEEDTESGCVELPLYDGEKPIDFYDADLIDLTAGTTNFIGGRVRTDRYACDGLKLRKGHLYRFRVKNRADHDRTYFHYRTTYVRSDGTRVELPLPYGDTLGDAVRLAADAGVNLVTFSTDNSWGCDSWWNEAGDESGFARLDALCERLIRINPKVLLIPRIIGNAPDWFLERHPESRMKFDRDYKAAMVSVSCRPYRKAVCEMIEKLVRHLQWRFPRNFAGLHVGGQNSAEWFYFNSMSGDLSGYDVATRDAFRDYLAARGEKDAAEAEVPSPEERRRIRPGNRLDPVRDRRLVDFVTFRQLEIATLLRDIGEAIRRGSDGRCLSLFFYGYTWELSSNAAGTGEFGHNAMEWLQREGAHAVDGFSGPFSYNDRNLTGSASVMSAAETCLRRGFLWINEDDTRTCREEFWDNHSRLFAPHADRWTTEQILLRDSISGLLRGTGEWWMDLFGRGWHRDPELWKIRKALNPIDDRLLTRAQPYEPEIAVAMDDDSLVLNAAGSNAFMTYLRRRNGYARCGGTYGQYFLDDLMSAPPKSVRLVYLISCNLTGARRTKLEAFKAAHPHVRVVEATAADVEAEAVAAHARAAGVHLYTAPNRAYVEAAEDYVMLQARQDGPLDVDFGVTGEIRDALTDLPVGAGPKLTLTMKKGEVRLFQTELTGRMKWCAGE